MKSKLAVYILFGWFFAAQTPLGSGASPEAKVTTIVGPFKSEMECNAHKDELEAFLKSMGVTPRIAPCVKKQEV